MIWHVKEHGNISSDELLTEYKITSTLTYITTQITYTNIIQDKGKDLQIKLLSKTKMHSINKKQRIAHTAKNLNWQSTKQLKAH